MDLNCEQQAIDNEWSLARSNACHIAVQNEEMGELRDEMIEIRTDFQEVKFDISRIADYQAISFGFIGIVAAVAIGIIVKEFWSLISNKKR